MGAGRGAARLSLRRDRGRRRRPGPARRSELKINFLKPFWTGALIATGRVVTGGRTVGLVECDVHDPKERLVARATSTCMTLRGEQAAGR